MRYELKRRLAIQSAILLSCLTLCFGGEVVQISVKDLPDQGLRLIPATDPSFQAQLNSLLGGRTNAGIQMESPVSVLLRNESGRTLLGYSLRWLCVDANGKTTRHDVLYQSLTVNNAYRLPPGGAVLASRWHALTSYRDTTQDLPHIQKQIAQFLQQDAITISLDGVIFDDGKFIGPNETKAYEQAIGLTASKRDLMAEVLNRHNAGDTDVNIFQYVESVTELNAWSGPGVRSTNWDIYYKRSAARYLLNLYRNQGPQAAYDHAALMLTQPVQVIKRAQ